MAIIMITLFVAVVPVALASYRHTRSTDDRQHGCDADRPSYPSRAFYR
jgi:hypothetical protein